MMGRACNELLNRLNSKISVDKEKLLDYVMEYINFEINNPAKMEMLLDYIKSCEETAKRLEKRME